MLDARKRSAGNRPSPKSTTDYTHSSGDHRHQAPTADERREAELLAELQARGYGITAPCLMCGHPLISTRSLARLVGPKCFAKLAAAQAVNADV